MSHCSEPTEGRNPASFLSDFRKHFGFDRKTGTREWPAGRIDGTDDGAFRMGTTVINGRIVIAFDRPVDWIGMTPQEASDMADKLNELQLKARGIA